MTRGFTRKRRKFIINRYLGYWNPFGSWYSQKDEGGNFEAKNECIASKPSESIKLEFEGMGTFSSTLQFIAGSGSLKGRREKEYCGQ